MRAIHIVYLVGYQYTQKKGTKDLLQNNFGTNKNARENYAEGILDAFKEEPPITSGEATDRILVILQPFLHVLGRATRFPFKGSPQKPHPCIMGRKCNSKTG